MKKLNLKWVSETIGNDYKNWKQGDIVLINAQTGTGKTWFIKNVLIDNSLEEYESLLYVCNRTNLKRQLKKDLLQKYDMDIPESIKELDEITTIKNITITSYHAINASLLDALYDDNSSKSSLSDYRYIIYDECHFIFADGSFNNKIRLAFSEIVQKYLRYTTRIYISATMDEIRNPILKGAQEIFGKKPVIYEYSTNNDYSYVKVKYFKKIDDLINVIKNDQSDEKWLVFISKIDDANKIKKECGEEKSSIIQSGTKDNPELDLIINQSRFNKKVLICTKAMDNGINISDYKLTNIVIMAWDKISFIQMLGRKRIDINNAQNINLFIATRSKKSFYGLMQQYRFKEENIKLKRTDPKAFYKKFDNDLKGFKDLNDIFYREPKTGEIKINVIGHTRLLKDIDFADHIINSFNSDKQYAYVHEQLRWIGLDYTFNETSYEKSSIN